MARNIFDVLFVISLIAPVAVLIVGAFALAIPTVARRIVREGMQTKTAATPRGVGW